MHTLLGLLIFLWALFLFLPQEAYFIKKHNLSDGSSMRFFYFNFELKKIRSKIDNQAVVDKLSKKIALKNFANLLGIATLLLYGYLLLIK